MNSRKTDKTFSNLSNLPTKTSDVRRLFSSRQHDLRTAIGTSQRMHQVLAVQLFGRFYCPGLAQNHLQRECAGPAKQFSTAYSSKPKTYLCKIGSKTKLTQPTRTYAI